MDKANRGKQYFITDDESIYCSLAQRGLTSAKANRELTQVLEKLKSGFHGIAYTYNDLYILPYATACNLAAKHHLIFNDAVFSPMAQCGYKEIISGETLYIIPEENIINAVVASSEPTDDIEDTTNMIADRLNLGTYEKTLYSPQYLLWMLTHSAVDEFLAQEGLNAYVLEELVSVTTAAAESEAV